MALHSTREQRKHAAIRRAQFALKTALERIDYLEDVVKPELQAMDEGRASLNERNDYEETAVAALEEETPS